MHRQMQAHGWDCAVALISAERYVHDEALDCMAPVCGATLIAQADTR